MAQVIKIIWRLDYETSFAYLDKRGSALSVLGKTEPNFWDSIGDGSVNLSFAARARRERRHRTFSLEPTSMNGAVEWPSGTDLSRALQDDSFRGVDKIIRDLIKISEVKVMQRAGIRLFCVEKFADGRRGAHERVGGLLDPELRKKIPAVLGATDDIGITLEGKTEDKISYRVTFGPYEKKNAKITLETEPNETEYKLLAESDLFFDIDLFERNFSFIEHSLFRWSETKVAKAMEFIALLSGSPSKTVESSDGGSRKRR